MCTPCLALEYGEYGYNVESKSRNVFSMEWFRLNGVIFEHDGVWCIGTGSINQDIIYKKWRQWIFWLLGVLFEGNLKALISYSSTRRQNELMTRLRFRLVGRRAGLCAWSIWTYLTCKVFDNGMMRVVLLIIIVVPNRRQSTVSAICQPPVNPTVHTPITQMIILLPDVQSCYLDCYVDSISKSQDACCAANWHFSRCLWR